MLTPIYFAAEFGYNDIVRLLLDNGTSTAFLNKAPSPLVASIKNNSRSASFKLVKDVSIIVSFNFVFGLCIPWCINKYNL